MPGRVGLCRSDTTPSGHGDRVIGLPGLARIRSHPWPFTERSRRVGASLTVGLVAALLGTLVGCSGSHQSQTGAPTASSSPMRPAASGPTATHSAAQPSAGLTGPKSVTADDGWIGYRPDRSGSEAVWLVHPDGSGDHPLDTGPAARHAPPGLVPDGRWIVFGTDPSTYSTTRRSPSCIECTLTRRASSN